MRIALSGILVLFGVATACRQQPPSVARPTPSAHVTSTAAPATSAPGRVECRGEDWQWARYAIDASFLATHDADAAIEPAWWTVDIYGSAAEYEASAAAFSRTQRLLSAISWYRAEVSNGGHDQFYWNSTGIVWPDALEGFRLLGLKDAAAILEEANARIGGNPSQDRAERQEQLDRSHPSFDDLDSRTYTREYGEAVASAALAYVRAHPGEFTFDGWVCLPPNELAAGDTRKRGIVEVRKTP